MSDVAKSKSRLSCIGWGPRAGAALLAAALSCGGEPAEPPPGSGSPAPAPSSGLSPADQAKANATRNAEKSFAELTQNLAAFADTACTWNSGTKAFTLAIPQNKVGSLAADASGNLVVNGAPCPSSAAIVASQVKSITVTGHAMGDETIILDFINGTFALGSMIGSDGINIDLRGGTGDAVRVRMSNDPAGEKIYCGSNRAGGGQCNVNNQTSNDLYTDIKSFNGVESVGFALGAGDDQFYGSGVIGPANVAYNNAFAMPIDLSGGDDDDLLIGGTRADAFSGGTGTDTVSYAGRMAGLTITLDDTANDGDPTLASGVGERDNVRADVEAVIGGAGADNITGSAASDTLSGGAGDDVIEGGEADDVLNGDEGNDTFVEGAAPNGADAITGGAGTADAVDYGDRTGNLVVTLDTVADDGAVDADLVTPGNQAEGDKVDVENVTAGSGDDAITGDAKANVIVGGAGTDALVGGAGSDTFVEGDQATGTASGADTIDGGTGADSLSYFGRSNGITVTLNGSGSNDDGETDTDAGTPGDQSEGDDLAGIERVVGTDQADLLTGSAADDNLEGRGGNDVLVGGGGNDQLEGDDGDDDLTCGAGNDIAMKGTAVTTDTVAVDCELVI